MFFLVSNHFDFIGNRERLFLQYYFESIVSASSSQRWINISTFTSNQSAFVQHKWLRFLDTVQVLIGPWTCLRSYKLQSCRSSHSTICARCRRTTRTFLTQPGRKSRASGQEADAMRTHQPVQTSVGMQRKTPTAAQHRDERKLSVCNDAQIPPVSLSLYLSHTRTRTHYCSLSSSWVFWLQTTAAPVLRIPPPSILSWVSKSDLPHDEA